MSAAAPAAAESTRKLVHPERINAPEIAAGLAALAVIVLGEIMLILGAHHHDVPLQPLAQLVARVFGA